MAPETVVVDASVGANWFLDQPERDASISVLRSFVEGKIDIVVPDLFFYEVLNALRFSTNLSAFDLRHVADVLLKYDFRVVPFKDIVAGAAALAARERLTVYDAAYLYLSDVEGADLLTYDRDLLSFSRARTP